MNVQDLVPGQHAMTAFSSESEQAHILAAFVRSGLERGERVLYFTHRVSPADVAEALRKRGVPSAAHWKKGA